MVVRLHVINGGLSWYLSSSLILVGRVVYSVNFAKNVTRSATQRAHYYVGVICLLL